MPSACTEAAGPFGDATPAAAGAAACAVSIAVGAVAARGLGGSGVWGHAASAGVRARMGKYGWSVMAAGITGYWSERWSFLTPNTPRRVREAPKPARAPPARTPARRA